MNSINKYKIGVQTLLEHDCCMVNVFDWYKIRAGFLAWNPALKFLFYIYGESANAIKIQI